MTTKHKFKRIAKDWDEFWAEFWRIRLLGEDDAAEWKNQQVVQFCMNVLDIRDGMTLLDLGCGAGMQARGFAEFGIRVHGIDISPPLIKHAAAAAKHKKLPATFAVGDMRELDFDEPFDRVVVLGMSFGFGTDAENTATLSNIFRAVKPGGKILLTGQHPYSASTHTGPEWVETAEGFLIHHGEFNPITCRLGGMWELVRPDGSVVTEGENPESDGIRCYSVPEIQALLAQAGFTRSRCYGSWMLPPMELQWFSAEMITVAERPADRKPRKKAR